MDAKAIATLWNAALVAGAIISVLLEWYDLTATIIGSMLVTALLTGLATKWAEAAADAMPFLTAFVGTMTTVFYWILRISTWLD